MNGDEGATMIGLDSGISRAAIATLLASMLSACSPDLTGRSDMDEPVAIWRATDPVVARVEGTLIYASDVQRAAAAQGLIGAETTLPVTDTVFRVTVEELIDQRLLALDAKRVGVAQQEEAQRRLAAARERILGNLLVETHIVEQVNEQTIRDLYDAQKSLSGRGEERRVRQIVVADEDTAKRVIARLNDEEDFGALVTEFSIETVTRGRAGEMGWVNCNMLPAPLRGPVFATRVGGRADPVQTDAGWHIIEMLDKRVPNQRSFEDTRDDIVRFMTFEAVESLMSDLRKRAEIDRPYQEMEAVPDSEPDAEP